MESSCSNGILLQVIPLYGYFAALSCYAIRWIDKKPVFAKIAELILIGLSIYALYILRSECFSNPQELSGIESEHAKMYIIQYLSIAFHGLLMSVSLLLRIVRKKGLQWLTIVSFVIGVFLFFKQTELKKIKAPLQNIEYPYNSIEKRADNEKN